MKIKEIGKTLKEKYNLEKVSYFQSSTNDTINKKSVEIFRKEINKNYGEKIIPDNIVFKEDARECYDNNYAVLQYKENYINIIWGGPGAFGVVDDFWILIGKEMSQEKLQEIHDEINKSY